jgi:hypothetical protein
MFIFVEATSEFWFYVLLITVIGFASLGVVLLIRHLSSEKFVVKLSEEEKHTVLNLLGEVDMSSKICSAGLYEFEKDGQQQKLVILIWPDSNEAAVLDLVNLNMDVLNLETHKAVSRKIANVKREPDLISFFKDSVKS